jgi:Flp pilus assembly protein TadB
LATEQKKRADDQARAAVRLRRRAFMAMGAAAIALILLAVSVLMWCAAQEQAKIANEQRIAAETARVAAEEQARIADSRRLVTESSSMLTKYPQRGLLLAVEAAKTITITLLDKGRQPLSNR